MENESTSLPLSPDEGKLLDEVIDSMAASFRRSGVSLNSYIDFNGGKNQQACEAIDKIIAMGVDRLRPVMKTNFIEKLHDRLGKRSIIEDDAMASLGHLNLRLMDTMLLVIAVQKKYRGIDRKSPYSEAFARTELRARGLWKQ